MLLRQFAFLLLACAGTRAEPEAANASQPAASTSSISIETRRALRDRARDAFTHSYDNYMISAFPHDVLNPLSCRGEDSWGAVTLTLLDLLDTLALLGNATEFERGVRWCVEHLDFDRDETVSLFETNIRALGGLLAAHAFALDNRLKLLSAPYPEGYAGGLLPLAVDLADRLMPALDTESGGALQLNAFERVATPRTRSPSLVAARRRVRRLEC